MADLHLGHKGVLRPDMDARPFDNIEQHDAHHRGVCSEPGHENHTLWILGDVANKADDLFKFMDVVKPVWDRVILIRGNHDDKVAWRHRAMFTEAHEALYVRINKEVKMYLSHYAHRTWRGSNRGSFHFHGHSHGALPRWGRSMDVGTNCIGYKPICLDDCVAELRDNKHIDHHDHDE